MTEEAKNTQKTRTKRAYKENKKPLFLEVFRKCGTIITAARTVGISREVVYDWRKNDPDFARDFEDADLQITELLETTALQRATEGVDRPIFYKGQQVGIVKDCSDTLSMFLLRARNPQKYRDVCEHEQAAYEEKIAQAIGLQLAQVVRECTHDYCPGCKTNLGYTQRIAERLKHIAVNIRETS